MFLKANENPMKVLAEMKPEKFLTENRDKLFLCRKVIDSKKF